MEKKAYIARAASDLEHVNRLCLPEASITKFILKADAKTSKCYMPDDAKPMASNTGNDKFHFVPEKETIQISYEIKDPFGLVKKAKLELFSRFSNSALWTLDLSALGPESYANGEHSIKWDGRTVKAVAQNVVMDSKIFTHNLTTITPDKTIHADFPDGYVTIQHSPCKLRLVLGFDEEYTENLVAWTYYQILIKSFVLELGPIEAIPTTGLTEDKKKMHKALHAAIEAKGGVPAHDAAEPRKVYLISNIYKTDSAQMNNNTPFNNYKTLWGDGPNIPIVAKISLSDSQDQEVKLWEAAGAKALGKVKFLWDWENVEEDVDTVQSQAKPKKFIKAALKYYKDTSKPKGDNCHEDRGGKRKETNAVFPPQAGYDPQTSLQDGKFPFKVEACTTRKWSAYSYAWTDKKLKGQTGVIFQPARMAGDSCKATVYLAYDRKDATHILLDVEDQPLKAPEVIKKSTGAFEIWREIHLVRYVRKKNAIADFVGGNLGGVQGIYRQAFIEVENKMEPADKYELPTAGYDAIAKTAIADIGSGLFDEELAVANTFDHSTTDATFKIHPFATFRNKMKQFLIDNSPAPIPDADAAVDNLLLSQGINDADTYGYLMEALLKAAAKKVAKDLNLLGGAKDGIAILHFDHVHSQKVGSLLGTALDAPGANGKKCLFVFWATALDTFVHEIGHHLFLPHARYSRTVGVAPGGAQPQLHDDDDENCIMSYNRPRNSFCGLCQLRLRGWDASTLDKDDDKNTKPDP